MDIQSSLNGGILTVMPEGRMDTVSTPELESFLELNFNKAQRIILDLEKVDYISSAGLRVVVLDHKKMKEKDGLLICHVNQQVMEVFKLTGYSHVLTIE